jgi:hypothetical protein
VFKEFREFKVCRELLVYPLQVFKVRREYRGYKDYLVDLQGGLDLQVSLDQRELDYRVRLDLRVQQELDHREERVQQGSLELRVL